MVVQDVLSFYQVNTTEMIRDILEAVKADLSAEFVHELIKMLFNVTTTTKLTTADFEDKMHEIRAFYALKGCDIKEPNEIPMEVYNGWLPE